MNKITWKDEYCVGVEKIDQQHQHLFELVNKLIQRPVLDDDTKLVSEILYEMFNYAKVHFSTEETFMLTNDYHEYYQALFCHKKINNCIFLKVWYDISKKSYRKINENVSILSSIL